MSGALPLAARIVAILIALGVILVTPVIAESSSGRSYDLVGIVIDVVALAVIVAVVWSARPRRKRQAG